MIVSRKWLEIATDGGRIESPSLDGRIFDDPRVVPFPQPEARVGQGIDVAVVGDPDRGADPEPKKPGASWVRRTTE